MNINSIMLGLEGVTGLEVEEDSYTGDKDEYIVFDYADVRGELFGDNESIIETASMIINITLIKRKPGKSETNYHGIAVNVARYLAEYDASGISYGVFSEKLTDQDEVRHLVFECKFTKEVEENA